MTDQKLTADLKEIESKITELNQSKNELNLTLKEKKDYLEKLLTSSSLKRDKGAPGQIRNIKKEIENIETRIKEINITLTGLASRKDQAEQALKESQIKYLIQKLRKYDRNILLILREKIEYLQKIVALEKEMKFILGKISIEEDSLLNLSERVSLKSHSIPNNLIMMDVGTELVDKFLPFSDQGLKEEKDRIERLLEDKEYSYD